MDRTKIKFILIWAFTSVLIIAAAAFTVHYREKSLAGFVDAFQEMAYKTERDFIENIPVYRDFAAPGMIRELQKFDLSVHAGEVVKHGIAPLKNTDDINENIRSGRLVSADAVKDKLYYFHNVRREYRYLTPQGLSGLELVASRFQEKLQARKPGLPVVKLAVSSVIRTVDYQEKVFGRKFVSTHSYGGCFDIFYEDYFVQLPATAAAGSAREKIRKSLHGRTGYLMGDALREQFRSVLMETLLELQRENRIYVFLEDDNRCYHITIPVNR